MDLPGDETGVLAGGVTKRRVADVFLDRIMRSFQYCALLFKNSTPSSPTVAQSQLENS